MNAPDLIKTTFFVCCAASSIAHFSLSGTSGLLAGNAVNLSDSITKVNTDALPINPYEYVEALKKIAESGDAYAQNKLGLIYDTDYEVTESMKIESGLWMIPKSDELAVIWYRRSADQEFAEAQYHLAEKYRSGKGVEKDATQYVYWYQRAANNGNSSAQMALGFLSENGFGVAKDDSQAAVWYRRSANQGNAGAQLYLAVLYSYGRGVPKDRVQSYAWSSLALGRMNDGGLRDALAKRMNAKEIVQAQSIAAAFVVKREAPEIPVRYAFAGNPTGISVHAAPVTIIEGSPEMLRIRAVVTRNFKDDESARFRDVLMTTDDVTGDKYVCGFVNGKNSYGAYTGYGNFYGVWKAVGNQSIYVNQAGNAGWCKQRGIFFE